MVCFAGTIGATGATIFLYYPGYYAMMEAAIREFIPDYSMTIFSSFIYNGFSVVLYVLTLIILMKVYKTKEMDMKFSRELFDEKYRELGKISSKEKKAVVMIVLLLVYLFTTRFTRLPAAYGFISIPFLMFLPGIVGAEVGFGEFLTNIAVPMLSGKSPLVTCIAFLLFGMIANFFMTPFAMLGGLSLTFAQIAVSLGISPIASVMILLYSCEILILPYQSAGNLIMYSYGLMPMKDFVKQQGLKAVIMIIGFIVVMYPLWNLFGLM